MALRKKSKADLIWTRSLKCMMYDSNTRNLKITPMKCKQLDQPFYRYTTCSNSNLASIDSCEYHGGISPGL